MKSGFGYIKWTAVLCACAFMLFCSSSRKSGGSDSGKGQPSPANSNARTKTDPLLENLLKQHPELFNNILKNRDSLRVQVIYTQINRLANNKPVFTNYYFNVNPDRYYYPASTVKLPTALLALQKLNELKIAGLDKSSTMITEGGYSGQNEVYNEPNSSDGKPSVANYVKKILLVSDNDAFNRLYEFTGPEYINEQLHKKGYASAQIIHRLERFLSEDENRHSNPISFYDSKGKLIYKQPMQFNQQPYPDRKEQLGNAFYRGDALIQGPMDFSKKNRLVLEDLHSIVKSILFPNEVPANQRFNISPEDYRFVWKYMSQFPNESGYPSYDTANYWDAYCKFLYWGSEKGPLPKTFRIFNKVGDAYGFLIDAAYVVDFATKTEFLLSASMYCNSDGVLNDSKYDYDSVGFPFMKNLGRVIYEYEKKRKKSFIPDLSTFQMNYEK